MRNWKSFGRVSDRILDDGTPDVTMIYPHEHSMRMCGLAVGQYNELNLIEDEDGQYMGWLDSQKDGEQIAMVQHKRLFNVQFPYGYKKEVERGAGEAVALRLEVVPNV